MDNLFFCLNCNEDLSLLWPDDEGFLTCPECGAVEAV